MNENWYETSEPENREEHKESISNQEETVSGEEAFQAEKEVNEQMHQEEKNLEQEMEKLDQGEEEEKKMDGLEQNSYSYIPPEPKKPEKKGRFAKKAAVLVAAALVFGLVAGGTFIGVNTLYGNATRPAQEAETQNDQSADSSGETQGSADNSNNTISTQATGSVQLLDVSDVVSAAMPSVVAITNTLEYTTTNMWGQSLSQEGQGSGSGVIIDQTDDELLIVTNAHVVSGSGSDSQYYDITSTELQVTFVDGSVVDAYLKGTDSDADLAVIAVPLENMSDETKNSISIATIGNSDDLKVGNGVIAIGNALGFGQSVTVGYVSALNREVTTDGVTRTMLQTDAAINPGNSGGALLNTKGELIGINAAKYSEESVEGIGYAIPITKAMDIIDNLKEQTTKVEVAEEDRGYIGITGSSVDTTSIQLYGMPAGVHVAEVTSGGPADGSGLLTNDIITKFDGETVSGMSDLQNLLKYYSGGQMVTLTVERMENGEYVEKQIEITLGYAKDMPSSNE